MSTELSILFVAGTVQLTCITNFWCNIRSVCNKMNVESLFYLKYFLKIGHTYLESVFSLCEIMVTKFKELSMTSYIICVF